MSTFDAAVLCLPFTLPQADIRRSFFDTLLSVKGNADEGNDLTSWEICPGPSSTAVIAAAASSAAAAGTGGAAGNGVSSSLGGEGEMGVAGGLGSGSALGNRARTIPASKYSSDRANQSETQSGPLMLRSLSSELVTNNLASVLDPASLLADAALLDRASGYRSRLLKNLPDLQAGLADKGPPSSAVDDSLLSSSGSSGGSGGGGAGGVAASAAVKAMNAQPWWVSNASTTLQEWDEEFGAGSGSGTDSGSGSGSGAVSSSSFSSSAVIVTIQDQSALLPSSSGEAILSSVRTPSVLEAADAVSSSSTASNRQQSSSLSRQQQGSSGHGQGQPRITIGGGGNSVGSGSLANAFGFDSSDDVDAATSGLLLTISDEDSALIDAADFSSFGMVPTTTTAPASAAASASAATAAGGATAATTVKRRGPVSVADASADGGGGGGRGGGTDDLSLALASSRFTVDAGALADGFGEARSSTSAAAGACGDSSDSSSGGGSSIEDLLLSYALRPTTDDKLTRAAEGGAGEDGGAAVVNPSSGSGNALFDSKMAEGKPSSSSSSEIPPLHQWAVTKPMNERELREAEAGITPVHRWPFTLDTFQRQAIVIMETEGPASAIFVAAHTSAGKTLVAEYAISLAIAHRSKCVYTSPIKALSNQKFHDLRKVFGGSDGKGVGIITGDVSLNAEAPCVIMTTEILRAMLYRGDSMINDIEWAVFDEIHYMNDAERGLAYEEVLLLLPRRIGLIFLSATLPNKEEFAEWVGRVKRKRVHVLSTFKRPVPLTHFLFTCNTSPNDLQLLMDGAAIDAGDHAEGWKTANYRLLTDKLQLTRDNNSKKQSGGMGGPHHRANERGGAGPGPGTAGRMGGGSTKQEKQVWVAFCNMLQEKTLLPAIIFCFSKKKCEEVAFNGMQSVVLTTARERGSITAFFDSALHRLSPVDRALPQIQRLRTLLQRGIGVHHSGLLPIMKECVEMLFSRGLVKLLLVTETFAMGISMPTRAVIFNGIKKHDGERWRELLPGEYTQMAGRSGRRGLDTRGIVIIMCWGDYLPDQQVLRTMMMGRPSRLASQFRLTYNMILNVMRTDLPVTSMMARSYSEFSSQKMLQGVKDPAALLKDAAKYLRQLEALAMQETCIKADGEIEADINKRKAMAQARQKQLMALKDGSAGGGANNNKANAGTLNVDWAFGEAGAAAGPGAGTAPTRDIEALAPAASGGSSSSSAQAVPPGFFGGNPPSADAFLATVDARRRLHMALVRDILARGTAQPFASKIVQPLLPLGRVVVIDRIQVPRPSYRYAPGSLCSSSASPPAGSITLWGVPAVVLHVEPPTLVTNGPNAAASASASADAMLMAALGNKGAAAGSGASSGPTIDPALSGPLSSATDAIVTVLLLAPMGYLFASNPKPKLLDAPPPPASLASSGAAAGAGMPATVAAMPPAGPTLVMKKKNNDDDLMAFMGGGGGKGGAKGKQQPQQKGGLASASASTSVGTSSSSSSSSNLVGLTPSDRNAYLGLYHRLNIVPGAPQRYSNDDDDGSSDIMMLSEDSSIMEHRTMAVVNVPLSSLNYITSLQVEVSSSAAMNTGQADRIPGLVTRSLLLSSKASLQALEKIALAAFEQLFVLGGADAADPALLQDLRNHGLLAGGKAAATVNVSVLYSAPAPAGAATVPGEASGAQEASTTSVVNGAAPPAVSAAPAAGPPPASGSQALLNLEYGHAYSLGCLNPFSVLRLPDAPLNLVEAAHKISALDQRLGRIKCCGCEKLKRQLGVTRAVRRFKALLLQVRKKFSVEALALYPEMKSRFKVLRKLGYTKKAKTKGAAPGAAGAGSGGGDEDDDDDESAEGSAALALMGLDSTSSGGGLDSSAKSGAADIVALKGRIAAEVNTADELLLTEMVFEGVLNPLSPAEAAALLSVLVFQDKGAQMNVPFPPVSDDAVAIGLEAALVPQYTPATSRPPVVPGIGEDADFDEGGGGEQDDGMMSPPPINGVASIITGGPDEEDESGMTAAERAAFRAMEQQQQQQSSLAGAAEATPSAAAGGAGTRAGGAGAGAGELSSSGGGDADAALELEAPEEMTAASGSSASASIRVTVRAIPTVLAKAYYKLQQIAMALGMVQKACDIDLIPSEWARERINHGLLLATYAWACGMSFNDITSMVPEVAEGVIVRTIVRLDECIRECKSASRILGDAILYRKMEAASACIKRDIVFANSLYLQ